MSATLRFLTSLSLFVIFLGLYTSVSLMTAGLLFFALLFFLMHPSLKKIAAVTNNPLYWPTVLLLSFILLSVLVSEPYDFQKAIGKIKYVLFYFFLSSAFLEEESFQDKLLPTCIFLNVITGISCSFQFTGLFWILKYFHLQELTPFPEGPGLYFASGFLGHHIHFATNSIFLYHITLAGFLFSEKRPWKIASLISTLFAFLGIILSFSRSGWIGLCFSTLVVVFLYSRKLALKVFIGLLALSFFLILSSATIRERLVNLKPQANRDRLGVWRISIDMFKDSPWLGKGYHSFSTWSEKHYRRYGLWADHPRDPHNMYLDMLGGTGLFGFSAFLIFLFSALYHMLRTYSSPLPPKSRSLLLAIIGGYSSYLIMGAFNDPFFITLNLMTLIFFLALAMSIVQKNRSHGN